MAYANPFVTTRPLPKYTPQGPMGADGLNRYLDQWYPGGAADPLGMNDISDSGNNGTDWGAIGSTALAGLSAVGDAFGMANQSLGIQTQAPGLQRSATGEPVYNVGQFYNQASTAQPQGATAGEVAGGALKTGASVLASTGNPLIAGGAALFAGAANLIGGRRRRKRQEAEQQKALTSAKAAQKNFNVASQQFDQAEVAQSDYLNRMNNTNRLYNLFS